MTRTILILLLFHSALRTPHSAIGAPPPALAPFIPLHPWRCLDGATNYIKLDGVEFRGKVMDILPEGVIINGAYGPPFNTPYYPTILSYPDYFVAHFPFQVEDAQSIGPDEHLMAWDTGRTYAYKTVKGIYRNTTRIIHRLDYGVPCGIPPELLAQQATTARAREERFRRYADTAKTNAFHRLQTQSTNGDAFAQYRLGVYYLTGNGCATNRPEALNWFRQSAAAGNLDASNKLATLPREP